jgi:hypothetical protein
VTLRSILVVIGLTTTATAFTAPVAAGEDTGPAATATIKTVEPAIPQAGDTLVFAGTVENTGDEPLQDVNAILRYSAVPLEDRTEVRRVGVDEELRFGRRYADFFWEVDSELDPGETAAFQLPVPVDQINFTSPGVYVFGVDIRANPADGERLTLDTARITVPWLPTDEPLPVVPVALLWPIATSPAMLPDATLVDDSMSDRLAADGPLTTMVEAPGSAPVTWIVDPDLVATVDAMADGYAVTGPNGTTTEGAGSADAAAWRETLATATQGQQQFLLPFANPDLPAIARIDESAAADIAREAVAATRAAAGGTDVATPAEIAWPGSGVADNGSLAALASAGVRTVVLSSDAVTPVPETYQAQVRTGDAALDAVVTDGGLDSAVTAARHPDPTAGATQLRQAWLAETALLALSAEAAGEPPPALVAAAPNDWTLSLAAVRALLEVWTTTTWVQSAALADLPTPAQSPAVVAPDPDAIAVPPELPTVEVEAAAGLRQDISRYAALLAEPNGSIDELHRAALRAVATSWRPTPEAAATYTSTVATDVSLQVAQVAVLVPESVTLSSNKGTFPLTVSNGLSQTVLVSVDVQADNPDRMAVADVPPQRVDAGENATVEVTAEATANGKVPVTVHLTASDGSRLGPAQQMIVNATDYGTIGWVVVGAAVAMFLAAAALRLIRAQRRPGGNIALDVDTSTKPEPLRETAR